MALFELLEHVVRDCLIRGHAVFNRQAVNHTEFDLAGLHIVREHVFEHAADSFVMIGPIPSPPQTPIMILSSLS